MKRLIILTTIIMATLLFAGCGTGPVSGPVGEKPQQQAQRIDDKALKPGQYKVGTDIPVGEYVAVSKVQAYFEIAKDATGTVNSIIANDNFTYRSIISVSDGQYLKIHNCVLYAFKDAPKIEVRDGFLPEGMYKIGTDIPAGEYKIISDGSHSYIEVSKSSRHNIRDIISNDNFDGDRYIKVSEGQYLKLSGSKIKVK